MIDKDKLLAGLRYSSQWNEPCPEWVYRKIQAMEGVEPEVTTEMVDSYVKPRCLRVITEELFVQLTTGKYLPPRLQPAQPETAKRIVGKSKGGVTLWYECDMCNEPVDAQDNFCRRCGRRLTDE